MQNPSGQLVSQTPNQRYAGVTSSLNNPAPGLEYSGIPANSQNMFYIQGHNAADIANDTHRNGTYAGFSTDGVFSYLKSAWDVVVHLVVADTIDPLFNWSRRVNNISTVIQVNQSGAQLGYDQATGAVFSSPTAGAAGGFNQLQSLSCK